MDRRYVLGAVVAAVGLGAALILQRVLATVFFAATVAYVLAPVDNWYLRRGLPNWWAALATTLTGAAVAGLVLSPLGVLLYLRFEALQELVTGLPVPDEVTLSLLGITRTVRLADVLPTLVDYLQGLALSVVGAAPVVAIKATLFGMVVYGLLLARDDLHDALRAVVPPGYHGALARLSDRARDTLFAIYVLQAATAAATFAVSVPVFLALGYEYPFTLATVAGFLQFLPIVGPSVLMIGVAAVDVAMGDVTRAVLVLVLGLVLIAYAPDPLVRPRLARRTADLPGSLYFVGFTGGLFTLGVVGVIAGPLVVALLSESVQLLAEEMQSGGSQSDLRRFGPPVAADRPPHPDELSSGDGTPPEASSTPAGEDGADSETAGTALDDGGTDGDAGGAGENGS